MAIEIRPLSPSIGAEILNVDLSKALSRAEADEIVRLWEEHSVLLFRKQNIDDLQHVKFVEHFGTLQHAVFKREDQKAFASHPAVVLISNVRVDGKLIGAAPDGELMFHSDYAYREKPGKASCLYAIEIPSRGGDTLFASSYGAYERLPETLKSKLAGLKGLNVYSTNGKPTEDAQRYVHPIVTTHPGTGRKTVFANRLMTKEIIGLPQNESDALLSELFEIEEQPGLIYAHQWQPGDLVIWDNRSCLHSRTDFDASERRLLRRVSTQGTAPQA
jgi:taurine dioxygenase